MTMINKHIQKHISDSAVAADRLTENPRLLSALSDIGHELRSTLSCGRKILLCGNGGSAAEASHFAAELVVRYKRQPHRGALPAISLACDPAIVTAAANDFNWETVFSRQVEALGNRGDALIAISTSGSSPNVLLAAKVAKSRNLTVIALTGMHRDPIAGLARNELLEWCDFAFAPEHSSTSLIQQSHLIAIHALCEMIERRD